MHLPPTLDGGTQYGRAAAGGGRVMEITTEATTMVNLALGVMVQPCPKVLVDSVVGAEHNTKEAVAEAIMAALS